jgi:DNA-binding ferritin-like protein (Dps family)
MGRRSKGAMDLERDIRDYMSDTNYQENAWDSNHHLRRSFRLMVDGSYDLPKHGSDYEHYQSNLRYLRDNINNKKKMRSMAISEFLNMVEVDYDVSRSTASKVLKETFGSDIEMFNDQLIDDLYDFASDHDIHPDIMPKLNLPKLPNPLGLPDPLGITDKKK